MKINLYFLFYALDKYLIICSMLSRFNLEIKNEWHSRGSHNPLHLLNKHIFKNSFFGGLTSKPPSLPPSAKVIRMSKTKGLNEGTLYLNLNFFSFKKSFLICQRKWKKYESDVWHWHNWFWHETSIWFLVLLQWLILDCMNNVNLFNKQYNCTVLC